jgi:uncharacterized heparinase superfamily protein
VLPKGTDAYERLSSDTARGNFVAVTTSVAPLGISVPLLWHTLKYLRPVQWRYRLKNVVQLYYYRRFPGHARRALLRRVPVEIQCGMVGEGVPWFEKAHDGAHGMFQAEDILRGCFTFLNCSKEYPGPVRWENPEFSYLWDFNLHYFEYLQPLASLGDDSSENAVHSLLTCWIQENPCPGQPGWHPYPLSLRTVNWIKLLVNYAQFREEHVLRSLYSQLLFLERNLEGHLQVNHLLENGRALLFGGLYFEGEDAGRWFRTGLRLVQQEIEEEYLPNGGHFERSPMYHCILLEGLLDTYAYLTYAGHDAGWLAERLWKMCEWLENVQCPDGTYPLFNDAAVGISATPDKILSNATRLLGYRRKERLDPIRDCDQFFVLDAEPLFCVVDGAPIGPSYNPGHAHSDNFTYEMFFRGERVVVDAGTFSYDVNSDRIASRSTGAHNTVVINRLEQSEVWGGFRVGRRSNPTMSRAGQCGNYLVFQGEYTNCIDPKQGISHERILVLNPSRWILVWDTIKAHGDIEAASFCRLGPGWTVREDSGNYLIVHSKLGTLNLYPLQITDASIWDSQYAPEFGMSLAVQQLLFRAGGNQHLETGYLFSIDRLPSGNLHVDRAGETIDIQLDGATERIELGALSS